MVDTPKEGDSDDEKDLVEDELLRYHQSVDVRGAALNPATAKDSNTGT